MVAVEGYSRWGIVLRVASKPFPTMLGYAGTWRRRAHAIRHAERVLQTLRDAGMAVDLDAEWGPDGPMPGSPEGGAA